MERIRSIVLGLSLLGFLTVATSGVDGGKVCLYNASYCDQCPDTGGYYWCDNYVLPGTGGYCYTVTDDRGCTDGTHQCGYERDCMTNAQGPQCGSVTYCNNNP